MKKALSIALSVAMLICAFVSTIPAYAETQSTSFYSQQTTEHKIVIQVTLNGEESNHTSYKPDKSNPNILIFTYTGGGDLIGWDFPNEVEGVDFIILEQNGNSITVQVLDGFDDHYFWANAIDNTSTSSPAKKDNSAKSPKTGAVTGASAIMIAGMAMLVATRKRK